MKVSKPRDVYETIDAFYDVLKMSKHKDDVIKEVSYLNGKGFRSICLGFKLGNIWSIPHKMKDEEIEIFKNLPIRKCLLIDSQALAVQVKKKIKNKIIDVPMAIEVIGQLEFDELDIILPWWAIRACEFRMLSHDLAVIRKMFPKHILKGILEVQVLDGRDVLWATDLVAKSGWDYVKTSTGLFGLTLPKHISWIDMQLKSSGLRDKCGVKAAGGIRGMVGWNWAMECGADLVGMSQYRELAEEIEEDDNDDLEVIEGSERSEDQASSLW